MKQGAVLPFFALSMEAQVQTQQTTETPDAPMRTITGSRVAIILCTALIFLWAIELLIIQEATTCPDGVLSSSNLLKYAARRLALNLLACTALVYFLNRAWLYGAFLLGLGFSALVATHAGYFGQPLSWTTLSNQWHEGLSNTGHGIATVSWSILLFVGIAFGIKVALREVIRRYPLAPAFSRTAAALAGITYLVFAVGLAGFHKPIRRVNIGSPEYTYGYAVAWATEYLTYDAEAVLADAIAKSKVKSHLLTEKERPVEFGNNIVVIQVESLDFDAVDATVGDKQVMPFLHDLKQRSLFYMVEPFHDTGTCDADFSLLTSSAPNGNITPFKVHGFPYSQSLPWLVTELGYSAVAIHGNSGTFFQRRPAYQQMGFSKLYFAKELKEHGVNGALDDELLQFSANLINESAEPMFHFIITWTSHGPFRQLPPYAQRLIPSPRGIHERYVNNMRYVDRSLEEYYEQLPDNTTVVIYGDHHSEVQGYVDGEAHRERVPWIICQKGKDLAERQETLRTGLATSGDLGQLEMVCFLRDNLEATASVANRASGEQGRVR